MGGLSALFEQLALAMMGGCAASAWLTSFIFIKLIGVGECPVISAIIGTAAGIGSLFILPTNALWVSMVIAAVVTLAAGIAIDKLVYDTGKSLTKTTVNKPTVNAPPQQFVPQAVQPKQQEAVQSVKAETDINPQADTDWECEKCKKQNTSDAKFCRYCGAAKPQVKAEEKADDVICPNCGQAVAAGRKFCRNCGEKVPEPEQEPKEQPARPVQPEQQAQGLDQPYAQAGQAYYQPYDQAYAQPYPQAYPQYYAQPYVQTAPNGDWMCPYCQNINYKDIFYCRRCGYPRSVPPDNGRKEKKHPGRAAYIIFMIVAALGVISNLLLVKEVIRERGSLLRRADADLIYYDLNKIEADFIWFEIFAACAAVLGYILMMILRKKPFGLIGSGGAALACVLFAVTCEQVKILNLDLTLTIVCLVASFVLCVIYCVFDKIWVGVVNIALSGIALYLLLSKVKTVNITYLSNIILWCNLVGNTLVMLLLGIANKLGAKAKKDGNNKVDNTQAVN